MDRIPSPGQREPLREPLRGEPEDKVRPEVRSGLRLVDDGRTRQRSGNQNNDPFNIDDIYNEYAPTRGDPRKGNIRNEIDFNWKRYEVAGKQDYSEMRTYLEQGWKPVQHSDFPGRFAPAGTEGAVIVKDMMLVHRPMRLTIEARNDEMVLATRATQAQHMKAAETPDGHAPRMNPVIRSTRENIEIPD